MKNKLPLTSTYGIRRVTKKINPILIPIIAVIFTMIAMLLFHLAIIS